MKIIDSLVRKLAKSFLLKWVDGYKTKIMRVVQTVNSILVSAYLACPTIPDFMGKTACGYVDELNTKWLALALLLGQLGLEFGIADAKAKQRERGEI